jgi:L-lactate dehydrogenase complex protein LldG
MTPSSSKSSILQAIRAANVAPAALPSLQQAWTTYPDASQQFSQVLEQISGKCVIAKTWAEATNAILQLPQASDAKQIVNVVPQISAPADKLIDLATISDPHKLADVDLAILRGRFGVAENGAVWVDDQNLPHRVIYFIAQHVVLVIPARAIVQNMHEAYQRLTLSPFTKPGFGMFVAGPSKTADIEQSLVVGAHGARSMTVVLVDELAE